MSDEAASPLALFLDASGTLFRAKAGTWGGLELYPDAEPILTACRARRLGNRPLKSGIITNWGKQVNDILREFGLLSCFDAVVCASDVPRPKPHPEIFHFACGLVEVPMSEAWHVGDSLHEDALAAQNAGLRALWLNRRPEESPGSNPPRAAAGLYPGAPVELLKFPPCRDLKEAHEFLLARVQRTPTT